jgi:hypothetical protein
MAKALNQGQAAQPQQPRPMPRPENFQTQIHTLRQIGASESTIAIVEAAAKTASGKK